jgi:hypothetical protein
MEELQSRIDELRSEVLAELTDAELVAAILEMDAILKQLETKSFRMLADLERLGVHGRRHHVRARIHR